MFFNLDYQKYCLIAMVGGLQLIFRYSHKYTLEIHALNLDQ